MWDCKRKWSVVSILGYIKLKFAEKKVRREIANTWDDIIKKGKYVK
jgi:hypothetical protein